MSLQLERSKQLEYNLTVLKRRDADIVRVLDMAGHVVLYQFNEDTKAWDKRNVEGSLFIVERASEPRHQFVVLNRLSSENLVETIDENFQTELTDQFLLYRNLSSEILGVWFYSAPERAAISELLDTLHAGGAPPALPTESPAATDAPPSEPSSVAAPSSVANFFNMMAGATVSEGSPPPMPASALTAAAAEVSPSPAAPPAPPPLPPSSTVNGEPPKTAAAPDLTALKVKLASQLRTLTEDDAFLTLLANEYVRQQQRAVQQARQQQQLRSTGAPPAPP